LVARHDTADENYQPLVVANALPIEFWRREIAWRDALKMGEGNYILGKGATLSPEAQRHRMDKLSTEPRIAAADREARDFLFWARMPFAETDKEGKVIIRDQRFDSRVVRNNFEVLITPRD